MSGRDSRQRVSQRAKDKQWDDLLWGCTPRGNPPSIFFYLYRLSSVPCPQSLASLPSLSIGSSWLVPLSGRAGLPFGATQLASLELWQSPSATDLLASIGKSPTEKRARILPFLDFLGGRQPKKSVSDQDAAALQNWVIQRLAKQMRFVKNPSIASRRDSGLIAALCAAPSRGTPRKWPQNCLKIMDTEVLLWDAPVRRKVICESVSAICE